MSNLLSELRTLRLDHPAWRLLCQHHAHFVVAVLHQAFLAGSNHQVPESTFLGILTDHLEVLQLLPADDAPEPPSRRAEDYISKWVEARFIRRTYRPGDQEPVIDLMPAAHRASPVARSAMAWSNEAVEAPPFHRTVGYSERKAMYPTKVT